MIIVLCNDPCDDISGSVLDWTKKATSNVKSLNEKRINKTNEKNQSVLASSWEKLWKIKGSSPSSKKRENENY